MSEQEKIDFFKTIESLKKYYNAPVLKENPNVMPLKAWVRKQELLEKGETCFTGEDSIKQAYDMSAYLKPLKTVVHNPQAFGYTILQCTDWDARLEYHRKRIHKKIDNYLFPEEKNNFLNDYRTHIKMFTDTGFLPFPGLLEELHEYSRRPETDSQWAMRMGMKMDMKMKFYTWEFA